MKNSRNYDVILQLYPPGSEQDYWNNLNASLKYIRSLVYVSEDRLNSVKSMETRKRHIRITINDDLAPLIRRTPFLVDMRVAVDQGIIPN
jgi:hypothetical protein